MVGKQALVDVGESEKKLPPIAQELELQVSQEMVSSAELQKDSETKEAGATVLLKNGVTKFYKKLRAVEPTAVSRFRDIDITVRNLGFNVMVPGEASIGTVANNKYTRPVRRGKGNVKQVVLKDIDLEFKAGTISLIVGPPGAGRSSLLKAIAGQLGSESEISGQVLYNGLPVQEVDTLRSVALVDQTDAHTPVLTVRETLDFASACQRGVKPANGTRVDFERDNNTLSGEHFDRSGTQDMQGLSGNLDKYDAIASKNVDVILRLLGLDGCADTIVGNAAIRGVSGGQRRRVTTGEVLVSGVSVLLGDEISTGLDSSATFDIVKALRSWAKAMGGTCVLALLQPSPEVVALFDQIVCLDQGQIVANGTAEQVERHFQSLGFYCPPRKDFCDFLQEVTSLQGRKDYFVSPNGSMLQFANPADGMEPSGQKKPEQPPANIDEFVAAFRKTEQYIETKAGVEHAYENAKDSTELAANAVRLMKSGKAAKSHHDANSLQGHEFANSWFDSLRLLLRREWVLACRDTSTLASLFGEALFVGLIMGGIFWQQGAVDKVSQPRGGMGALFFCCAILQRQAWQQIPILIRARPTFYKQRKRDFFPTSAFVTAFTLCQIPFNVLSMAIFCPIVYFMVGFRLDAGAFFFFFLTMVALQHALRALFMCIGAASRSASSAQYSCSVIVVSFLLFSGYVLSRELIPSYWIWVYWLNPLAYALRSLALNEYTLDKYTEDEQNSVFKAYGLLDMNTLGFRWAGPVLFAGYFALFCTLTAVFLQKIRFDDVAAKAMIENHQDQKEIDSSAEDSEGSVDVESQKGADDASIDSMLKVKGSTFIPITLAFQDLHYSVPNPSSKGKEIKLLNGVSGVFKPGQLTALMGSSGAGKTTLMDCIAGRKNVGKLTGTITLNGVVSKPADFSKISGYCEQLDVHSPDMTVRESFLFSASLRQPEEIDQLEKATFVENVIDLLELGNVANRLIGESPREGLSVEQRKRVTIGVELAANPSVLFCDEPTSGLDSAAALLVMRVLQKIAQADRTVISTIHQPSAVIFEMFDNLVLLKHGGFTVYNGPLGHNSSQLISYFEGNNAPKIAPGENPANYMLNVIGGGISNSATAQLDLSSQSGTNESTTDRTSSLKQNSGFDVSNHQLEIFQHQQDSVVDNNTPKTIDYVQVFEESQLKCDLDAKVTEAMNQINQNDASGAISFPNGRQRATSLWHQFKCCSQKAFTIYYRSPQYNFRRVLTLLIIALLFGTAYLFSGKVFPISTKSQARSFGALIYLCMDFIGILNMVTVLPITFRERTVFYRERAAQMYSSSVYTLAIILVELPYLLISVGLFTVVSYFLWGLTPQWFGYFFLVFFLYVSFATFAGQFFAIASPHEVVGQVLVGFTTVILNLASGYLVAYNHMPPALSWIYWISPSGYAFNGLASVTIAYCPDSPSPEFQGCNVVSDSNVPNQTLAEFAEDTFDLRPNEIFTVDIPALFGYWILTIALIGLSLKFVTHDTK